MVVKSAMSQGLQMTNADSTSWVLEETLMRAMRFGDFQDAHYFITGDPSQRRTKGFAGERLNSRSA
jgi:hypothetical protein